jgi:HAD superfamily hydrolase (TIGR01509 family)
VIRFAGRVVTGCGEAAAFTRLDWAREAFLRELGIDPYPGTVNLVVEEDADRAGWSDLQSRPGYIIDPPNPNWCRARCYAVRLNGWLPAGVVIPDVPGYPPSQVELVAALPVRQTLSLGDGDRVAIETSDPLYVRAVIFDVDGTLVDSLTAFRVVAERAAAPYGVTITDAIVREALNTSSSFWDLALPPDCADRIATMEACTREAARLWPEVLRDHGRVYADVGRVLRALRDRGLKLGIMTGSRRGSLQPLRDDGLIDLFEALVTGDQVARRKPDPEGLIACAGALEVAPADAVYVGDTPLDIQAARAAGMFAVGMLVGAGDSAVLSACGPHHLVPSHGRLLDVLHSAGS